MSLLASNAFSVGNETINVLPDSNKASFRTDSQNFWKNELPDVLGRYLGVGFIQSGGKHNIGASCTSNAFSVEAFTDQGNRVTADGNGGAVAINYSTVGAPGCVSGTTPVHVAACATAGAVINVNWHRYSNSNIFTNFVDPTTPAPTDCVGLMQVTIVNGAITKVIPDVTPTSAFPPPSGVNIADVGGVCDGTTDNTAALQRAIDLATSNGTLAGKVTLTTRECMSAEGYKFTQTVNLKNNLELDGGNAVLTFVGSGAALRATSGTNKLRIHGLTVRSTSVESTIGIDLQSVSNVFIDQIEINGANIGNLTAGISITASSDIWISSSRIIGNKGSGISISGTSPTRVHLIDNFVSGNSFYGLLTNTTGGDISASNNIFLGGVVNNPLVRIIGFQLLNFINNTVTTSAASGNIVEINGSDVQSHIVRIDGNTINGTTTNNALIIDSISTPVGSSISYNFINVTSGVGIRIIGRIFNMHMVNNTCSVITICTFAPEGTGTTIAKANSQNLILKVAQGNSSLLLSNTGVTTILFSTPLHAYTLTYTGQVRVRSNWFYLNASGSTATVTLIMSVGGTNVATCGFTNTSTGNSRAIYWDVDLAAQNSENSIRVTSKCGITDGSFDATGGLGGGIVIGTQKMHTSLFTIPSQATESSTILTLLGAHSVASPNTQLFMENATVESLGQ